LVTRSLSQELYSIGTVNNHKKTHFRFTLPHSGGSEFEVRVA
jgi:hypothetical protein